jgi:hypothetical protein
MSTEPETSIDITDSSKNIRTYAKDYAAVSGKNPESTLTPVSVQQQAQKKIKEPKIKVQKVKPPKPPKKPKPVKEPKNKVIHEAPIKEELINSTSTIPIQDQERLAILERLKARVSADGSVGEIPKPQTQNISLDGVVPDSDTFKVFRPKQPEPVLPKDAAVPIVPAQPPAPPVAPPPIISQPQSSATEPSPIHTYKSDFADEIDAKHASKFSVLAAEKDAPIKKQKPIRAKSEHAGIIAVIGGVILLIAGGGALAAGYTYMVKNTPAPLILGPASLISYDSKVQLSGSGSDLMTQLAQKAGEALPVNTVLLTYIDESTTTPQGVTEEPATGGAFITELNLQAPNILIRNIDPNSMVGIVNAKGETAPFFILKVDSYESTFAGMLQWESSMLSSLRELYPLYPKPVVQQQPAPVVATTSSTSTSTTQSARMVVAPFIPQIDPSTPSANGFVDEIVDNHSVRVLKDNSGRTILIYGYYDKATLIIARDESAFTLLVSRLTASGN